MPLYQFSEVCAINYIWDIHIKHKLYICRANDKSASVPVCYERRVTSRTEITCLEDAIKSQRTHTEYCSPIGVNDIGRNPASDCAKRSQPIRGSRGHQSRTLNVVTQKSYKRACAQGPGFSLGLTLEVLSSRLMRRSGTPISH